MIDVALERLLASGVRFVLIGGAALELHGSGYRTFDIDVVYDRTNENIAAIVECLAPLEPRIRAGTGETLPVPWDARFVRKARKLSVTTNVGDVDLFDEIPPSLAYADLFARKLVMKVPSGLTMLNLEGLRLTKTAANRPKDRLALPEIEAMIEARDRAVLDESEIFRIGAECAALPVLDDRTADEILGYDSDGLPS